MRQEEIQRYEKMLAKDPDSRAFAPLAEAYRKAGDLDMALSIALSGLEIHPNYVGGLVVSGRVLFEKGEYKKAMEALSKAVADSPENYRAQKCLAKTAMELKDNETALTALKAAALLSPEDEEVVADMKKLEGEASSSAFKPVPDMDVEDMLKMSVDPQPDHVAEPSQPSEPGGNPDAVPAGEQNAQAVPALAPLSEGLGFADEQVEADPDISPDTGSSGPGGIIEGFEQFPPPDADEDLSDIGADVYAQEINEEHESLLPEGSAAPGDDAIVTETMAEIYADQGEPEKAEELYRQLMHEDRGQEAGAATPAPDPVQVKAPDAPVGTDSHPGPLADMDSPEDTDDKVVSTLENWLKNMERMSRK